VAPAELRLPVLALPGLSPDSLGNYLASLGLLRVLSRKWPSTRIAWRDGATGWLFGHYDANGVFVFDRIEGHLR
jgi:hypothetical protein